MAVIYRDHPITCSLCCQLIRSTQYIKVELIGFS